MNFDITTEGGAAGALDAVKNMQDYINNKELRLKGSIAVATNSLTNKQAKNTAISSGVSALRDADKAAIQAELIKLQLLQSNANGYLNDIYSTQTSNIQTLLSSSGYGSLYNTSAIYASLLNNNSLYNSTINQYIYDNLYDSNGLTSTTTKNTTTTSSTSNTSI
jgi:hypothetical protein